MLTLTDSDLIHQVSTVFRMQKGDRIILCDGKNKEAEIEITDLSKKSLDGKVLSTRTIPPLSKNIHLFVSLPKKSLFETIVEMTTELGVATITPILAERSVKTGLNDERINKIAREAAELSGRGIVPDTRDIVDFEKAIAATPGKKFLCDKVGRAISQRDLKEKDITIFIGPEGGFTEKELTLAKENGIDIVSLGETTLRIETAAITALAKLA